MIDPQSFSQSGQTGQRSDNAYGQWEKSARRAVMRLDPQERTAGPIPVFGAMVKDNLLSVQSMGQAYAPGTDAATRALPDIAYNQDDDATYSFNDVIDMINPLQNLPVIGTIYRSLTGDGIKPMSSIIGGTLFGGPIGAVSSTINAILKDRTGKDLAENALSLVGVETPGASDKPEIIYDRESNARANAAYTAAGQRNFSSAATMQIWNS